MVHVVTMIEWGDLSAEFLAWNPCDCRRAFPARPILKRMAGQAGNALSIRAVCG
jgi:hypothetical protein